MIVDMAKGSKTQEFIARNKAPIVTAKRLGLGAIVGIQQAGLEEIDARTAGRQPDDFLAVQNLVPILESAILIPISLLAKQNTVRVIAADLLVGTTAMSAYRLSKMLTPIIANRLRKDGGFMRGISKKQQNSGQLPGSINPMQLNTFTLQ